MADATFETAASTPDVILVPGGGKPSIDVLEDEVTMEFLAKQGASAQWVVAVCTGSLLLGKAGLLKGYRAASHWAVIDTLDADITRAACKKFGIQRIEAYTSWALRRSWEVSVTDAHANAEGHRYYADLIVEGLK